MTIQEHIAHIERAQEEARKFAAETRETTLASWPFAITDATTTAGVPSSPTSHKVID